MGRRYRPEIPMRWIQPRPRGYRMMCCDCGLVHGVDFRVVKYAGGKRTKVQFRAWRDARATAATRRQRKRAQHLDGESTGRYKGGDSR
jgi:hypothetical protein